MNPGGDLDGGDLDGTSGDSSGGGGDDADTGGIMLPDSSMSCTPKTCTELGKNCGPVADGCGGLITSCGDCTAPDICGGGGAPSVCGTAPCTKKTCSELDATCGMQGDGCGGLIDCGTCTGTDTCGGGGVANHCGTATPPDAGSTCTPKTCMDMGINCGPAANGCGGLVDCGTCATGACGGGGVPNVCGSSTSPCLKKTCSDWGANCGPVSDGCGGLTADCGTCTGLDFCGGGGTPSVCGHPTPASCTKKTCADFPGLCGVQPDGCGTLTAYCNPCSAPQTCGGGGVPSVCGGTAACVKKTCADFPAGTCGQVSDGCGGLTTDCGGCTGGNTCGGGGTPSVCGGAPTCTKKTCADYPVGTCGQVSDGCGGLTANCMPAGCPSPSICGGGGVASKCGGGGTSTTCVNLACKQVTCTGTATTSISGTVYDPAGLHPLPNVFVYVPNAATGALATGASCDKCSAALSGSPLVTTTTDVNGKFKLDNMPVDANVPVVFQIGKWRRQVVQTTTKCVDTAMVASKTRLPKNKSEGDIPKIALATGSADPLECLLRKIGIDDAEFTQPTGTGRVNLFSGNDTGETKKYNAALGGATFPTAPQLWDTLAPAGSGASKNYGLMSYDVVMLGCEGQDTLANKSAAALKAMQDYVNAGGRVFGEHYHYSWLKHGPGTTWPGLVTWNTTSATLTDPTQETVLTTLLPSTVTPFPKGQMMSQWMKIVAGATAATPSLFPVNGGRNSIKTINDTTDVIQWIQVPAKTTGTTHPAYPQYFSFNTPVGAPADSVCGRFVFSDIHVSSGDSVGVAFPNGCTTKTMTPQELALEFMFFDLASRVCDETVPPPPPTCTKLTCVDQGIECGAAPDGCGGSIANCGTCVAPKVCSTGGKCAGSSCTPTSCTALGYTCGSWPDGCGGSLNCGPCVAPATCGGGGVAGTCGGTTCTKTTCTALGYDCGTWPDGCGGTLDCGVCTAPTTCGGSGAPGKCGGTTCTKTTCTALGYDCGAWPDGCGGSLNCGVCVAPKTCGGGGTIGKCGDTTSCVKKSCADLGITCGLSGDGCGGSQDCGPCPTTDAGPSCTPLTCGGRCGPQGDGCGGILTCPACDGGSCVPTTCAKAGAECGNYPDGCGGLLTCGTCTAPATCGGSGVANKCGGIK